MKLLKQNTRVNFTSTLEATAAMSLTAITTTLWG